MTASIFENREAMDKIAVISEDEEDRYTDVPGWDGTCFSSNKAIRVTVAPRGQTPRDVWLPFSQLRKAADGQSVYASVWILDQKGIG